MADVPASADTIATGSTPRAELGRVFIAVSLGLIVLLAALLRWHGITARDFFFDELWITELSSGHGSDFLDLPGNRLLDQPNLVALDSARPAWQVPAHITGAIHPPATFVMLRLWREVFGDSMFALRSFSAAWSVLVVVLVFIAGRLCFGSTAGLFAGLLSAISSANVDQAQDVRGYTMLQAWLLLTSIALLRMRGKQSCWPGAITVGIGTLLMMYTHYFAAGACAGVVVGSILLPRGRARWQTLGAIAAAGVIWLATWLPQLKAQLAFVPETADIFLADRTDSPPLSTLLRLLASPYRAIIIDDVSLRSIAAGASVFYLLALRLKRSVCGADRKPVIFWLFVGGGVIGQLLALDLARQSQHLEFAKYVLLANPALCVLLGSLVFRSRWLMPTLLCATAGVMAYLTPLPTKTDSRPQFSFLKMHTSPDDLFIIATDAPHRHGGQALYLFLAQAMPWSRHHLLLQIDPASPTMAASLPRDRRWFFLAFDARTDPALWLPGTRIVQTGPANGCAVYEVKAVEPSTAPAAPSTRPAARQ